MRASFLSYKYYGNSRGFTRGGSARADCREVAKLPTKRNECDVRSCPILSQQHFVGCPRAILIQGQAHLRNLDSKKRLPRFDNFKIQFHSSISDTFSTASAHRVISLPCSKLVAFGAKRTSTQSRPRFLLDCHTDPHRNHVSLEAFT